MANANTAYGLRPVRDNGTPFVGPIRTYYVPSSSGTALYVGDPVVPLGGGDAFGVPSVGIATAGGGATVLGAVVGIANGPAGAGAPITTSTLIYRPASTAAYIYVTDDPNQLYSIQEDSVGGALASASAAFENADLVAGSGSTFTAQSGWMLDSSTAQTTNTLQLRIIELLRGPDNAIGNFAKWLVRLNTPALWAATGY